MDATHIVGVGEVVSDRGKEKRPGVFMEVLRYRRRFLELGMGSVNKVE